MGLITSDFIKKRPLLEPFTKLEAKFKRVVFIDLLHSVDKDGLMRHNEMEVDCTFFLLQYLADLSQNSITDFKKGVAIITPYKGQVKELEKKARQLAFKQAKNIAFAVNTVDSF